MRGNQQFVSMRARNVQCNSLTLSAVAQGKTPCVAILNYARISTSIESIFGQKFGEILTLDGLNRLPSPQEISVLEYGVTILGIKVITILEDETTPLERSADPVSEDKSTDRAKQIKVEIRNNKIWMSGRVRAETSDDSRARATRLQDSPLLDRLVRAGQIKIIRAVYDSTQATVKFVAV
jgi:carbonic anhydrase